MKFKILIMILSAIFFSSTSYSQQVSLKYLLKSPIAVEKQTGRGDSYDVGFSGWVGSLQFDFINEKIYISEINDVGGKPNIIIGVYALTNVQFHSKSISFNCTDNQLGLGWSGKVWLQDDNTVKINIVMDTSPRRWVNLDDFGRKFLNKIKLDHMYLGL